MLPTLYLLGLACYCFSASLPFFQWQPSAYYGAGVATSIVTILAWLTIAKVVPATDIVIYGLIWDVMITIVFITVPVVFWSATLSATSWIGVAIAIAGVLIAKLG